MATSRSPPFPQPPTSAAAAIPYFSVSSAQGFGRPPQIPSPTTSTSYLLPSPYEQLTPQHPLAYLPASRHIPVSVLPHAAFPQPQVIYAAPNRVQRSVTMPTPGPLHSTQVADGPYQSFAFQAPNMPHSRSDSGMLGAIQTPTDRQIYHEIEDDSDYEDDGDDLATHGDGTRAKDPPFAGIQRTLKLGKRKKQPSNRAHTLPTPSLPGSDPPNGPPKGLRARMRNLVNRGPQPPNQPTTPVRLPQQATFFCRLPECQVPITGDIAALLSGFCCNSHMKTAINNRIATLCLKCKQRACLEGGTSCGTGCANILQLPRH